MLYWVLSRQTAYYSESFAFVRVLTLPDAFPFKGHCRNLSKSVGRERFGLPVPELCSVSEEAAPSTW